MRDTGFENTYQLMTESHEPDALDDFFEDVESSGLDEAKSTAELHDLYQKRNPQAKKMSSSDFKRRQLDRNVKAAETKSMRHNIKTNKSNDYDDATKSNLQRSLRLTGRSDRLKNTADRLKNTKGKVRPGNKKEYKKAASKYQNAEAGRKRHVTATVDSHLKKRGFRGIADSYDRLNDLFFNEYNYIAEDDFVGKLNCIQDYMIENADSELTIADISHAMVIREDAYGSYLKKNPSSDLSKLQFARAKKVRERMAGHIKRDKSGEGPHKKGKDTAEYKRRRSEMTTDRKVTKDRYATGDGKGHGKSKDHTSGSGIVTSRGKHAGDKYKMTHDTQSGKANIDTYGQRYDVEKGRRKN